MIAIETGHSAIAQMLIHAGANCNYTSREGTTPLFLAASKGDHLLVNLLFAAGAKLSQSDGAWLLHVAVEFGNTQVARILLRVGAPLNSYSNDGATPLFRAAERGHYDTTKLLLEQDAEMGGTLVNGATPLSIAVHNGHTTIVQLLLQYQAHSGLSEAEQRHLLENAHNEAIITLLERTFALARTSSRALPPQLKKGRSLSPTTILGFCQQTD